MHCPACKKFMGVVSKQVLARKPDGSKVYVLLSGHKCQACGYVKLTDYEAHVKQLGLLPYGG